MPAERSGNPDIEDSASTQTVSSLSTTSLTTVQSAVTVPDVSESSVVQLTVQDLEDLEKIQAELDSLTSNLATNNVLATTTAPTTDGSEAHKPVPVTTIAKTATVPSATVTVENKTHVISVKPTTESSTVKLTCPKTILTKATTVVPVSVVSTSGESHPVTTTSAYTIVAVSTNSMMKVGKQVLLVQKPVMGTSSLKSGGTSLVSTVTPLSSSGISGAKTIAVPVGGGQSVASSTTAIPITTVKNSDLKVIVPQPLPTTIMSVPQLSASLVNNLNLLQKRIVTTSGGSPQILNKFKVVNSPGNAQLGNVTLSAAGSTASPDGTIQPTILLASPTKAFTVARGAGNAQVIRELTSGSTKQNVVLLSPLKAKLGTMPSSVKSPLRIAPAPNTADGSSKVTIINASAAGSTVLSSGDATKTTTTLPLTPPRLILRSLVPQQATVKAVTSTTPATQTSTTATTGTIKQVVVPVSSVLNTVQQIQVPGSKFSYVRLVSAPMTQGGTTTTSIKQATLVSTGSIRPMTTTTTASISSGQVRLAVPIAPAMSQNQATRMVGVKPQQRILIPSNATLTQIRPDTATLGQFTTGTLPVLTTGAGVPSFVMVSAQYMAQLQQNQGGAAPRVVLQATQTSQSILPAGSTALPPSAFVPIAAANTGCVGRQFDNQSNRPASAPMQQAPKHVNGAELEGGDLRPRKPCNCTKSQCLKLYCDCFANGEFCNNCNCNNCSNNLEHEEERQKAIKSCLDRNPQAFHPKIGKTCKGKDGDHERRHTKGCNCKRSGCLKNYCECYEAKILCTSLCKCVGCKNFEDSSERKTLMHLADAAEVRVLQQATARTKISSQLQDMPTRAPILSNTGERLPFAFVTQEVVEATCQCLLARAEEGENSRFSVTYLERLILEEFGRCLVQIIESANKTKGSS